jgi:hypothetical protein
MMEKAQRHGPFVTRLASQGARLCKEKMMGLGWRSFTDKTGQGGDELEM